jgi:hypothetical protein
MTYFDRDFEANKVLKGQGSTAQITHLPDSPGYLPLFHSRREQALIVDATVDKGFGFLPKGTVLAENAASGNYVPYAAVGSDYWKSFAVADVANAATSIKILKQEAYIFQVGFSIVLEHDGTSQVYHDGGAITAVDLDSSDVFAEITFTTAVGVATFTTANKTKCYIKSGTVSDKMSDAVCVLDKDIDTGFGQYAVGGNCSIVLTNAVLYSFGLLNLDSEAKTALNGTTLGRFFVLR